MTRYFRVQCCSFLMGFKCCLFQNKISKTLFLPKKLNFSKNSYQQKIRKKQRFCHSYYCKQNILASNFFGAVHPFNPTVSGSVGKIQFFSFQVKKNWYLLKPSRPIHRRWINKSTRSVFINMTSRSSGQIFNKSSACLLDPSWGC